MRAIIISSLFALAACGAFGTEAKTASAPMVCRPYEAKCVQDGECCDANCHQGVCIPRDD